MCPKSGVGEAILAPAAPKHINSKHRLRSREPKLKTQNTDFAQKGQNTQTQNTKHSENTGRGQKDTIPVDQIRQG
jgi:hypothetical protein